MSIHPASTTAPAAREKPPGVVAVVVTFNRQAALRTTLSTLLAEALDHVIVVDSGSTDGTRDWLAATPHPRLTVILAPRNRGGAAGFETGLRTAVARLDPDWCVLMDDDACPVPGAIAAFQALDLTGLDAVAAAVTLPAGPIAELNRPWWTPFAKPGALARLFFGRAGFHLPDAAFSAPDPLLPIDGASFVGFFIARSGIARAGFPDGRLFIYGDDVLYSLALRAAGGKMAFAPGVRFVHDCGNPEPGAIVRPLWKIYYLYRNRWFVYRAAAGPVLFWPIMSAIAAGWLARACRLAQAERKIYLRLTGMALSDARRLSFDRDHAEILAVASGRDAASERG